MLDRHHLLILQSVDQQGTLTEAAKSLHLTQSALSHTIKKLEASLGTTIWRKEGRNIQLTQAGQLLLSLANRVLPQFIHSEQQLKDIAQGKKGKLRIGMECHPCYQWLLKVVNPFLTSSPNIDVDIKQAFKFGGMGALMTYEIDLLITPDPLFHKDLSYMPVFDYEHVLVVSNRSSLLKGSLLKGQVQKQEYVQPHQLSNEVLITYPVEPSRLDIFSQFLTPSGGCVKQHKIIETTEIILQMVNANRGVAALPRWLVEEHQKTLAISPMRLGEKGVFKQIFLGVREHENQPKYVADFIELAKKVK